MHQHCTTIAIQGTGHLGNSGNHRPHSGRRFIRSLALRALGAITKARTITTWRRPPNGTTGRVAAPEMAPSSTNPNPHPERLLQREHGRRHRWGISNPENYYAQTQDPGLGDALVRGAGCVPRSSARHISRSGELEPVIRRAPVPVAAEHRCRRKARPQHKSRPRAPRAHGWGRESIDARRHFYGAMGRVRRQMA